MQRKLIKNIPYLSLGNIYRLPNLIVILFTQYFVRIFLIGNKDNWILYLKEVDFFLLVIMTLTIGSAGYIINDYYDIKIDSINRPNKVIIGRKISRRVALTLNLSLNIIAIGLGLYLGWQMAMVAMMAIFLLWLYSNYLKRLAFWSNFTIAFLVAGVLLFVAAFFKTKELLVYMFIVFAFFIALIRGIIKDMEDIRGDMHFGLKTFPIIWGIRKTKTLLYGILALFEVITVFFTVYLRNIVMQQYFLLMLFSTLYFIHKLYWADTKKNYTFLVWICNATILSGIILMIFI